jgi:HAE1 family hydrophobic/amphiphilic exporter-1
VGVLVQNALVVVQRLAASRGVHGSRAGESRVGESRVHTERTHEARIRDAEQIAPAVIGSTLTTAVVLFPFLYLQGNARAAFAPFAAAFVIALVWSVITALLVVPALGIGVLSRQRRRSRTHRVYAAIVARTLRWRIATLTFAAAAVGVLAWGFVVKVPRSSFGGFGERRTTLSVGLSFPRGSDPHTLDAAMRDFEQLCAGRPEVEQVRASSRGTAAAQMLVTFTRSGGFTAVPAQLQELLTQRAVLVGGANVSVFGDGPGFSSGGGGGSMSTFRLRLLGYSYDGVGRIATDLKARLERIPRVRDVRISAGGYFGGDRSYQITLEPDRASMARYGVSASQLGASIAREVRGPAGRQLIEIAGDELPVNLKSVGARDRSIGELQEAIVPTRSGAPVRIGDLSVSNELEALSTIQRQDQQYVLQVAYDFRGPAKLARRTHEAFVKTLAAPPGYSIADVTEHFGDDADASEQGLYLVFAMGLALVLLAVALVFDSVWSAMMVLVSLPLSLAGVAAAFWFTGTAFTREAAVGVILVVGLAVNHAILVIDAALRKRRVRTLTAGDVLRAMHERAGMIVCVTLASLASLAPLSVGADTTRLFGAIALATAGGTIAGTLGVLFVLPAMMPTRSARAGDAL